MMKSAALKRMSAMYDTAMKTVMNTLCDGVKGITELGDP